MKTSMRQQLEQRLKELKTEFESGQKVLVDLDYKRTNVQETLLRIQGAIQVLEEELSRVDEDVPSTSTNDVDTVNGVQPEVAVLSHG